MALFLSPTQGPSSPRNVGANSLSISIVQVRWEPPEDANGGIVKYVIEYQLVGRDSLHPLVDTDDGNKTTKDVTGLNSSTLYQFRVRAFSKVPGEWSKFVQARTQVDGMILEEINGSQDTFCVEQLAFNIRRKKCSVIYLFSTECLLLLYVQ